MKYLTKYKLFQENTISKINMSDLTDIMFEITDEYPNLYYSSLTSDRSSIIKNDDKSFIILLIPEDISNNLYYLEPTIFDLIENVSNKLERFGLTVFYSDFGETDNIYEIVVTEIGHKPEFNPSRYDEDGNPK